jgi:hypothetical protein
MTPNSMSEYRTVDNDRCENLRSNIYICLEFVLLTAVVMKTTIFLHVALCSPLKVKLTFCRNISPQFSV